MDYYLCSLLIYLFYFIFIFMFLWKEQHLPDTDPGTGTSKREISRASILSSGYLDEVCIMVNHMLVVSREATVGCGGYR